MGVINIEIRGSFSTPAQMQFSALQHGHADAVAQAIQWLSAEVLPKATAQDHSLHEQGLRPERGFTRHG